MRFGMAFANTGPAVTGAGAAELAIGRRAGRVRFAVDRRARRGACGIRVSLSLQPIGEDGGRRRGLRPAGPPGVAGLHGSGDRDAAVWVPASSSCRSGIPSSWPRRRLLSTCCPGDASSSGIGAGWLAEEFAALGRALRGPGCSHRRLHPGDAGAVGGRTRHVPGRVRRFRRRLQPSRPMQRPIPIVVGGHSKRAARRAGELGDGFFPNRALP